MEFEIRADKSPQGRKRLHAERAAYFDLVWRKVINGEQAMTSNDIEIVAGVFDQSAYEFIRAVREWNSPDATVHYPDFTCEPVEDERAVALERSDDPNDSDEHWT